jgi:isopentenyl-diphosphate delta-isomerase
MKLANPSAPFRPVEIVDHDNVPLGAMPLEEARQQGLFYRVTLVLLYDKNNKIYLKKIKQNDVGACQWDLGLETCLHPGESTLDGAYRIIRECIGRETGKLRLAGTILPSVATGRYFVTLYKMKHCYRIASTLPRGTYLLVDRDELSGIVKSCPDLVTQRLAYLWKHGKLFDAW